MSLLLIQITRVFLRISIDLGHMKKMEHKIPLKVKTPFTKPCWQIPPGTVSGKLFRQMYEAALLTRCYTQHALHPLIDSEINHKRHFIKIAYINKGIDFIDLPSIFQDKSVTSSKHDYFQNSEPPVICYISITNQLEI